MALFIFVGFVLALTLFCLYDCFFVPLFPIENIVKFCCWLRGPFV